MEWRTRLPDKKDVLVLALLIVLPVIAFSELFFLSKTLYRHDITSIHYPLGIFKGELLSSGQLPFWNPHILFGFPQVGDGEILAFYPLNLVFLLPLRPYLALTVFVTIHFILGGMFTYLLARTLGISRAGALIAAIGFTLGGYLMAQVTNVTIVAGSVWFPLILLLFVQALQTMKPVYAALCAGILGLQILASHPQIVFYSVLTLGAYGVFVLIRLGGDNNITIQEKKTKTLLLLSLMAVAVLGGLALAAVQIAPTWELKALSDRATGRNYETMTAYSLPPVQLLTLLFPNLFGNPVIGYQGAQTFEELHVYAGILPLMLIPWIWARRKRDKRATFFAVLAGVSLLLALGRYTFAYRLLVHVPGFDFFRAPGRWLFISSFSLSVLAGYGYDALFRCHGRPDSRGFAFFWRTLFWLNIGLCVVLFLISILDQESIQPIMNAGSAVLSDQVLDRMASMTGRLIGLPLPAASPDMQPSTSLTLSSLNPALPFILMSNASFLLIYLWSKSRLSSSVFQGMVIGLIAVDLLIAGGTTINPVRDASYFESKIASTTFLQQRSGIHRIYPIIHRDDVANLLDDMPAAYGLYSVEGHISELAIDRYQNFVDVLVQNPVLRDLAGVKYVLLEGEPEHPGYVHAFAGDGFDIYENTSVLPRAFVVHQAEVVGSEQSLLHRLLGDDFDPRRQVLLEEEPVQSPGEDVSPAKPALNRSDLDGAEITFYAPHRVVVEADLNDDGFVVLSDTYYPGWKAFVDGRETRIYRANYLFRAVPVSQGEHVVEFRYNPPSIRLGLAISMVALAILFGIVLCTSRVGARTPEQRSPK